MASELSLPLYQVDLSSLVSKWVGETEKNLKAVFKAAEGVRGILLFDEGDALFSTRTEIKSSQDRNSNMEVNYLLQEIERFSGILLLSTNHFNNMDPAFLRRFTYTITFGAPVQSQRRAIWQTNLPAELPLDENVDIGHLSHFDLTGGDIRNCIRQAAARAAARKANAVLHEDFLWAIKREMQKHDLEIERELVGEKFWRKIAPEWEFKQPL
jgi:SpoVK/Ycf46/Vps4 family AAA+-type ATPase